MNRVLVHCQFEGCSKQAAPGSMLAMCPIHDEESTAMLREQVAERRRTHKAPESGRAPRWNVAARRRRQFVDHEGLREVLDIVELMTEEERDRMGRVVGPALPSRERQGRLGVGGQNVTWVTPKVWAYLTGRLEVAA